VEVFQKANSPLEEVGIGAVKDAVEKNGVIVRKHQAWEGLSCLFWVHCGLYQSKDGMYMLGTGHK